jgi:DNA-binding NarL/FixJ family response regulator
VVALTVFEDRASIIEAICAGADGYLLKRTPADDLLVQLRAVLAGGSPLSAGVAKTVLDVVRQVNERHSARSPATSETVELTDRELELLACLVHGMSYKAAARALGISIDTVRSHIRGVYGKLQVHSVAEAVSRALREGLV